MAKSVVISVNPNSSYALALAKVARQIPTGRPDVIEGMAAEAGLVQLVFPSRDAGLGTSLILLALRVALALAGGYAAVIGILSGTVNLGVALGVLGCSVFLLLGFMARPAALGLGVVFLLGAAAGHFSLPLDLSVGMLSLIAAYAGGGWFAADYHIGRRILRSLRRRSERRMMGYSSFRYN